MEFFKQAIEHSPNPTYVKNDKGKFVLANNAFAVLHGTTVEALLEQGSLKVDYSANIDMDLLKTGDASSLDEYIKRKDGKKVWYNTVKKPIYNKNGERWLLSISSDITELKKSNISGVEAIKAKSTFLANVSHEIRTPMNGIIGMARLLQKTDLTADQETFLQYILSNADSLLVTLNEILDYTNVESGNIIPEKNPFDIINEISNIVEKVRPKAIDKGLELIFQSPEMPLPMVEGDPYLLSQVLNHLINNAIKFTKSGHIYVLVHESRRETDSINITFTVMDTGIGISNDKFEQVFESFNQAYASSARLYGGTGLGLTLSKKIIELQGGKIWLESTPDIGSKFFFSLPYKISTVGPEGVVNTNKIVSTEIKDIVTLLVEDNNVSQLLAHSYLISKGALVDLANNGKEALSKTKLKKYDIILMDIQMPLMSGIDAAKNIRQEPNINQNTPIIAFTANVLRNDLNLYKKAGFNDFLAKPFLENDLYRIVSMHAEKSSLSQTADNVQHEKQLVKPLYDFSNLGSLAQNTEFLHQMMELFISSVPGQIENLNKAVKEYDWNSVVDISHNLKSTFGNIQIMDGYEALKRIEEIAASEDEKKNVTDQIAILEAAAEKIITIFKDRI